MPANPIPRDVHAVRYVALIAGSLGAMYGEYQLAQLTGMPGPLAVSLPLLISLYAYAAFRAARNTDVALALLMTASTQGLAHMIKAGVVHVEWWTVLAVWSVALPLALWRMHHVGMSASTDTPADAPEESAAPGRHWTLEAGVARVLELDGQGIKTPKAIGAAMGVSPQRAGQILKVIRERDKKAQRSAEKAPRPLSAVA